jgi:broad specificity phosphatase PhoE
MPRTMSVEEALKLWQEKNEQPPAWETDEDLWERSREWINDLLQEIKSLERLLESVQEKPPEVYHVLVASHAGIVRVILLNLVGHDRIVELGASWDASRNNRLVIPNASLSILEVDTGNERPLEDVKVIELTNAKHLDTVNMYDD